MFLPIPDRTDQIMASLNPTYAPAGLTLRDRSAIMDDWRKRSRRSTLAWVDDATPPLPAFAPQSRSIPDMCQSVPSKSVFAPRALVE